MISPAYLCVSVWWPINSVACVPVYVYACTCLCVACVCQRVPRCLLEAACRAACEPMNKTCLVGPRLLEISLTSWPPVTVLSRYQSSDLTPPWALGTCALVCCEIQVYLAVHGEAVFLYRLPWLLFLLVSEKQHFCHLFLFARFFLGFIFSRNFKRVYLFFVCLPQMDCSPSSPDTQ